LCQNWNLTWDFGCVNDVKESAQAISRAGDADPSMEATGECSKIKFQILQAYVR
jgi:hypothetical protein